MANTYTQLYIHVIFSVQGRQNIIHKKWKNELYKYICGIINNKKQKVYAIGGVEDHVHLLISLSPSISLSDLVKDIKANSSKWINDKNLLLGKFKWQEGFGAFSYSQSQINNVINYINSQEIHHQKKTFKDEYLDFLNKFNVEHDEKYLFEWIK